MKAGELHQLSVLANMVDFSPAPVTLRAGDTPTFPRPPSHLTVYPSLINLHVREGVGGVQEGVGRGSEGGFGPSTPEIYFPVLRIQCQ